MASDPNRTPGWTAPPPAIDGRMAVGAAWMVLFKLLDRLIGFASVIVLARLLVPADFGLITLAASTIAVFEVLGAFGLDIALIQRSQVQRRHLDAAWTFNAALGLATALVTAALAVPAASFYRDSRVIAVMLVLAVGRAIQGLGNIGPVAFRKELRFDLEFRFLLAKRAASAALTIGLAFALRSYWALMLGTVGGTCIGVALSYAMHPYRPRPSWRGLGELMQFSKWLFFANVVDVLHGRLSDLIVGRGAGAASLGALAVARDLARLPTRELAAPVHRAVFPGYVHLASDREELRRGYLKVASLLALLALPAAIGLALIAEPAVSLLLGARWAAAVPLVRILAINGLLGLLVATAHYVNLAVGMARSTSIVLAADLAVTVPLLLWLVPRQGAVGAAWAMLLGSASTAPLNAYLLAKAIRFGVRELATILARPALGSIAMAVAVLALLRTFSPVAGTVAQIGRIASLACVGATVYAATVYVLWRRRADPDAVEHWVLLRAGAFARKARGWLRVRPS